LTNWVREYLRKEPILMILIDVYAYLTFAITIHVRKLTHLSLSTLFCLIIPGIVIRKQRSFIFYNFQKYFYEFCDLWWRSLKIEDYKPHWRLLRYIEMRIIKTWSKWIQSYSFLYVNSRAHLFIFMIYIRLFWLVITECSHSIIQDLSSYAFVWRRMFKIFTLTLACISCHYLATGILTVFELVALLQKPSFQFNYNRRSEFKKGETFCWPSSWHCSSYFHTATDTKMLIFLYRGTKNGIIHGTRLWAKLV